MFQSRDLHYYVTAHGYRFRYKASGTSATIPKSELNNNAILYQWYDRFFCFESFKTFLERVFV